MKPADLPARIAEARGRARRCDHCAWMCGVNREETLGRCGVGVEGRVDRDRVSVGEEGDLSPSHLVYFTGCNLRCSFCHAGHLVDNPGHAPPVDVVQLGRRVGVERERGTRNLNLLGGDPSVNLVAALELIAASPPDVPVVWNTNGYHSKSTARLLDGVVDTWLFDVKFGNDACARRVAQVPRYGEVVLENLRAALATSARVIVRHLLMPGHLACCAEPVARQLAGLDPRLEVHFDTGFVPAHRAHRDAELLGELDERAAVAERLLRAHGLRPVRGTPGRYQGPAGGGTLMFDSSGNIAVLDASRATAAVTEAMTGPAGR